MNRCLNGLTTVNVELTSRCNKNCWMCGRRKVEREYPELALEYGDMNFDLAATIARQLPPGIVVQLHNNGESLLHPCFGEMARLFSRQITNVVTNGKLLVEKADQIIDHLDTIAISVIENDPEADQQLEIIREFLRIKGNRRPFTLLRLNGNVDKERYESLGLTMATRIIHSALGSFNYRKRSPTIPEIGICLDLLNHLAINSRGLASVCVRFDPKRLGVLGDVRQQSLAEIWNSAKRRDWIDCHKSGRRDKVPLCSYCHFWGVPTGWGDESLCPAVSEKQVCS